MTTEDRWQKLDAIWRSALQLEGSSRAEYVRQACAGDEALRSEIESLLGFEQNAGDFLEPPGASQDSGLSGRSIAHYQVLEKLGEGGMGVVYKAFDTHLNRPVAIKVLRPEVVADPDRRRRFVLEARSASALNHPNIITVYDITTDRGFNLIVMEFVEGKRLADLIPRHGMPQAELLKVAVQIAEALSAAHGRGIVHRDVKPANTMVTNGGLVKLLDFGLAKLIEPDTREPGATRTGTLQPETETGAILGTVAYMSPEQAAGRKVDARTDIFSFGAMLYEMASGRQPFRGGTRMETVSAILSSEPAPIPGIPQDLEKVITRCLRKDPDRRFQHMDDVAVALRELKEESDSRALSAAAHSAAPGAPHRRVALVFAALSALLLAAFLFWRFGMQSPQAPTSVVPLTAYPGSEITPAFSPDGKQVAFSWNGPKEDNFDIYVSLIGTSTPPVRLTTDAASDACPVWSPDGRWIAFVRRSRELMLMPALGGPERGLSEIAPPSGL